MKRILDNIKRELDRDPIAYPLFIFVLALLAVGAAVWLAFS